MNNETVAGTVTVETEATFVVNEEFLIVLMKQDVLTWKSHRFPLHTLT